MNDYHVEAIKSAMDTSLTGYYEIAQTTGHGAIMSNKNAEKILDSQKKKTQNILLVLLQETQKTNSLLERILESQKP